MRFFFKEDKKLNAIKILRPANCSSNDLNTNKERDQSNKIH